MLIKSTLLTVVALMAFAANSVLCRLALKDGSIDAITFTQIRLFAGAAFLAPFFWNRRTAILPMRAADFRPAVALFAYAIAFSLSYVTLDAGVGALILFGAVQFTMIGAGFVSGERPGAVQLSGVALAFAGLVWLLAPGATAPPIAGAALMVIAGIAWGGYSLYGKGVSDPVAATARNFLFAAPLGALLLLMPRNIHAESTGIALAIASGAIASGAGYVIWYGALKELSNVNAAVVQLSVPVIAALGGAILIGETLTSRLIVSSTFILGGIFLAIRAGRK